MVNRGVCLASNAEETLLVKLEDLLSRKKRGLHGNRLSLGHSLQGSICGLVRPSYWRRRISAFARDTSNFHPNLIIQFD
jgi:hypothetical protein